VALKMTRSRALKANPSENLATSHAKKAKLIVTQKSIKNPAKKHPNILDMETQKSIVNLVLERLSGKAVLLHGIEKTKA
jgi:hypothetical protein